MSDVKRTSWKLDLLGNALKKEKKTKANNKEKYK